MGGHDNKSAHGHGHGHHGEAHGHGHHHGPIVQKSVIFYDIPEPAHPVSDFKAPDWKIYKVENAPELVKVQSRLANLGLKDPWLRNEVWRYDTQFGSFPARTSFIKHGTTGMKWGLMLAVGTIVLETAYNKLFGKEDHHGHGHGHAKAHH